MMLVGNRPNVNWEHNSMNNLSVFYHHVLDMAKQCDIGVGESLDRVRAMGYEGLVFDSALLTDRAAQRGFYRSVGLAVTSVYANVDFVHWEPERCRQAANDLLECCAFFGARIALVLPGVFRDGDDRTAGLRKIYAGLETVCRLAKGSGIDVTVENFGIAGSPNGPVAGCLDMLANVEGLKFTFDTGNFSCYGEDPFAAYATLKDSIAYVHLKDHPRGSDGRIETGSIAIGDGALELDRLIQTLVADGYAGVFAVEHFDLDDQLTALRRSADFCRRALGRLPLPHS